jgi:hypothetical protein
MRKLDDFSNMGEHNGKLNGKESIDKFDDEMAVENERRLQNWTKCFLFIFLHNFALASSPPNPSFCSWASAYAKCFRQG